MKVLAVSFSSRNQGNCMKCLEHCLDNNLKDNEVELINIFDYKINGCGECEYRCFGDDGCCIEDDAELIYRKCFEADKIIFAVPTFCGNLASVFFKFMERSQAIFKWNDEYENKFLKKINFIIIGNISAGGDMALHEALYIFSNMGFYPETVLLSSRDYNKKSINGDLIEVEEVRKRLDGLCERIINKK